MPRPALELALLLAGAQVLGACASLARTDPPVCDGRARRPANPWGSILSPAPELPAVRAAPANISSDAPGDGGCA